MKSCSNCFQIKPVSEFYRKLERYQSRCKKCNSEVCSVYAKEKRRLKSRSSFNLTPPNGDLKERK